jgi:hypothetical protein
MARPVGTGKYKDGTIQEAIYEESHPEKLLELLKLGKLDCEIAASFGISTRTMLRWKDEHDNFKSAYELGKPACEAWWIEFGKTGMSGKVKGYNFNSWVAFMNNKFG